MPIRLVQQQPTHVKSYNTLPFSDACSQKRALFSIAQRFVTPIARFVSLKEKHVQVTASTTLKLQLIKFGNIMVNGSRQRHCFNTIRTIWNSPPIRLPSNIAERLAFRISCDYSPQCAFFCVLKAIMFLCDVKCVYLLAFTDFKWVYGLLCTQMVFAGMFVCPTNMYLG